MSEKIKGFDGLRGISVMLVIMSHGVIWSRIGVDDPKILRTLSAHTGVNVFFALSGFLITLLLIRERAATGTISIKGFFARRVLRIFPLYFLAITFLLVIDWRGAADINNCTFGYAYTYTQNFSTPECTFSSTSHFWSLAVEEHFYLAWPLIFLLGRRFALGFAAVFAALCLMVGPDVTAEFAGSNRWTFPAAAPIAFGCIAAFVCEHPRVADLFASKKNGSILLIAIIAGLASPAFYPSNLIWMTSVAALILYVFHNQQSTLVRLLEFTPLALLGLISYGLYVWQGVFTGNGPYRVGADFPPVLDTGLWLTFIVAPLSYVFFERPILRLKRYFSWRSEAGKTAPRPQHQPDAIAAERGQLVAKGATH